MAGCVCWGQCKGRGARRGWGAGGANGGKRKQPQMQGFLSGGPQPRGCCTPTQLSGNAQGGGARLGVEGAFPMTLLLLPFLFCFQSEDFILQKLSFYINLSPRHIHSHGRNVHSKHWRPPWN